MVFKQCSIFQSFQLLLNKICAIFFNFNFLCESDIYLYSRCTIDQFNYFLATQLTSHSFKQKISYVQYLTGTHTSFFHVNIKHISVFDKPLIYVYQFTIHCKSVIPSFYKFFFYIKTLSWNHAKYHSMIYRHLFNKIK